MNKGYLKNISGSPLSTVKTLSENLMNLRLTILLTVTLLPGLANTAPVPQATKQQCLNYMNDMSLLNSAYQYGITCVSRGVWPEGRERYSLAVSNIGQEMRTAGCNQSNMVSEEETLAILKRHPLDPDRQYCLSTKNEVERKLTRYGAEAPPPASQQQCHSYMRDTADLAVYISRCLSPQQQRQVEAQLEMIAYRIDQTYMERNCPNVVDEKAMLSLAEEARNRPVSRQYCAAARSNIERILRYYGAPANK